MSAYHLYNTMLSTEDSNSTEFCISAPVKMLKMIILITSYKLQFLPVSENMFYFWRNKYDKSCKDLESMIESNIFMVQRTNSCSNLQNLLKFIDISSEQTEWKIQNIFLINHILNDLQRNKRQHIFLCKLISIQSWFIWIIIRINSFKACLMLQDWRGKKEK